MGWHWRPVGPLPEATYWRRRAVLVALLLAALLLLRACAGGDGGDDERLSAEPPASPAATPSASATPPTEPSPEASATPSPSSTAEVATCADDQLVVTPATDLDAYPLGSTAQLRLTVASSATAPCSRPLGPAALELLVTSGADRIWSSDDCSPGGEEGVEVLEPGAERTVTVSWPLVRSLPGCPDGRPALQPGTYRLSARVGALEVEGPGFTLTAG